MPTISSAGSSAIGAIGSPKSDVTSRTALRTRSATTMNAAIAQATGRHPWRRSASALRTKAAIPRTDPAETRGTVSTSRSRVSGGSESGSASRPKVSTR